MRTRQRPEGNPIMYHISFDLMSQARRLSILIPLYNEEEFIAALIKRVLAAPLPNGMEREIIIVDDGSTDGSLEVVEQIVQCYPHLIRLIRHTHNQGKGAAIRTAVESATGEFCIIQDADLEYDPGEYPRMLKPLLEGVADVVFGSRFMIVGERRVLYFWHSVANHILTTLANIFADLNLTDMETCYKAFRTSLIQSIPIRSNRFGIEPEITIKVAQRHARVYETPISYHGRTYEEGKKIGFKDAVEALFVILKTGLTRDIYKDPGVERLESFASAPHFNRWMADTLRPYIGDVVIEVGAGIGNVTRFLIPRRKRYVLTDIDHEHVTRLNHRFHHRPNVEVRLANLMHPADFESFTNQMDSVVCINVLEHMQEDVVALHQVHSMLGPGGRAVILVPQGQWLFGTLDVAFGHYRRYSEAELREKMRLAGFTVERVIKFNRISSLAWYINGKILKRKTLGRWQLRLFDSFVWLWRKIDRLFPWSSVSLVAIGVKQ